MAGSRVFYTQTALEDLAEAFASDDIVAFFKNKTQDHWAAVDKDRGAVRPFF